MDNKNDKVFNKLKDIEILLKYQIQIMKQNNHLINTVILKNNREALE